MVKGQTYDKQLFESDVFRHFINVFTNKQSGITKGCELTKDTTTITVSSGCFLIQGGFLKEVAGTELTIPSEAGYYKLVYEVDLSKTNTTDEFKQGNYKFVKGSGDYPDLTQEDLDGTGKVYQLQFCQFKITEQGLQDFLDIREQVDYGIFLKEKDIEKEKAFIVAYLNDNYSGQSGQAISNGEGILVNLAKKETKGDYFELDSISHTIKVLKDCQAIISGSIFVNNCAGVGYVFGNVKLNNTPTTSALANINSQPFTTVSIPAKVVDLKQDDIIKMTVDYTSTSGNPNLRWYHEATFLSIVKI